jgi:hypothetical protein
MGSTALEFLVRFLFGSAVVVALLLHLSPESFNAVSVNSREINRLQLGAHGSESIVDIAVNSCNPENFVGDMNLTEETPQSSSFRVSAEVSEFVRKFSTVPSITRKNLPIFRLCTFEVSHQLSGG